MIQNRENDKLNFIPAVEEIKRGKGTFPLSELKTLCCLSPELREQARLLAVWLTEPEGREPEIREADEGEEPVILLKKEGSAEEHEMGFPDESYSIAVKTGKVILSAPDSAGMARAVQTFRQLAHNRKELPVLTLRDRPRLPWRGMHLDVSRHFFPREDILRFIDTLALFRFNKLHLHLTDDQGWRAEIKKYPRLTEVGAWREATQTGHFLDKPHRFDDSPYGGYYTREDMEKMVAFAAERGIDIVPEIDMPGHMQAAIAAYPELGCTDMTIKTRCQWGISQHILNPEESTVRFMKDVLDEIMDIFPSTFIHIGGDEAHKYEWEEQRSVQDRMAELGVESEDELQSWFISQMGDHIRSRGRRMIGWDEILEGGLSDGAIVMSWRGEAGGIEAARKGAPVINCTNSHTYFDYYQKPPAGEPLAIGGDLSLEKVYSFEPVPGEIPDSKKHLVMGSQGQLWSEYMADFPHVEYMAFPRALALAECLWCPREDKDWESFRKRLPAGLSLLDSLGVNYCGRDGSGTPQD